MPDLNPVWETQLMNGMNPQSTPCMLSTQRLFTGDNSHFCVPQIWRPIHRLLIYVCRNPALESQAADRIYRVGQTKDVVVHRSVLASVIVRTCLIFPNLVNHDLPFFHVNTAGSSARTRLRRKFLNYKRER